MRSSSRPRRQTVWLWAGRGDYTHAGSLGSGSSASTPLSAAATAAGAGPLNGENIQGGLTLSSPSTSLGLTAQHSIMEVAPSDQVSSVSLSASQTVFDGYPGGRAAAAVQQADYTYRAAQVAYEASLKSVIYQVKQAYYTLLVDQKTVLIREATVTQDQQNLAYYHGLLTAGRATQLDVLQNQVTLTQAQLDLRTAQNTVAVDRGNLSQQVGWPQDKEYLVADSPIPDLPSLQLDEALKTAFQNRSELLTFDLNIAAANINLALQKSQIYSGGFRQRRSGTGTGLERKCQRRKLFPGSFHRTPDSGWGPAECPGGAGGRSDCLVQGPAGPGEAEHNHRGAECAFQRAGHAQSA